MSSAAGTERRGTGTVIDAVMPRGVEQLDQWVEFAMKTTVIDAVMPRGVEQTDAR